MVNHTERSILYHWEKNDWSCVLARVVYVFLCREKAEKCTHSISIASDSPLSPQYTFKGKL